MSINHTQLRAFHAVAEAGGYSSASRALGLTQPALTMQVRALESGFGIELFRRVGRGVELTETGLTLQRITRRYFGLAYDAEEYLRNVGEFRTGSITLAADGPYHIMPVLGSIHRHLPAMKIHVSLGNSNEVVRSLLNYKAHLGFSSRTSFEDGIEVLQRNRNEIVLMVPQEHRFGRRRQVRLDELKNETFIMRESGSSTRAIFVKALEDANIDPNITIELGNQAAVREAVAHGLGISVVQLNEFGNDDRLSTVQFSDADIYADECLICMRERIGTPLLDALLEAVFHGITEV